MRWGWMLWRGWRFIRGLWRLSGESGSRFRAIAHLSDDEAVAKMGHPMMET